MHFLKNAYLLFYVISVQGIHSTQHVLLNLINKWHSCLDNSGEVGTILMDLSKAFHCLPHELVLVKLHAYQVDIKSLKLLQDYLSNWMQRVKLDSTFSSWLKILLGVPLGSILGPLRFNISLNIMLWFVEITDICNFADQSYLIYSKHYRKLSQALDIYSKHHKNICIFGDCNSGKQWYDQLYD